jgi:hypothetical protein
MKTLKSERCCENRSLFMHQNVRKGVEYGQENGDTNFNDFQHGKSVCVEKWSHRIWVKIVSWRQQICSAVLERTGGDVNF